MKVLLNPWFIVFFVTALSLSVLRRIGAPVPAGSSYLTDLLTVPLLCGLGLAFLRLITRQPAYRLSHWQVAFVVAATALFFEVLLPQNNPRYTADWIDVLLYCLGGWLFWLVLNK